MSRARPMYQSGYQLREAALAARMARAGRALARRVQELRQDCAAALPALRAYRPRWWRWAAREYALREVRVLQFQRRATVRALVDNEYERRLLEKHLQQLDAAIALNEADAVASLISPNP